MSVGFRSGGIWTEIGDSNLLQALFSTISYRLEAGNWGSQYPYLLKKLYYDKLESGETANALVELNEIRTKFTMLKPEEIVWDAEDLTKKPPVSFDSYLNATNLSECFIAVSKRNIFDVLHEVLEFCKRRGISVTIQSSNDLIK